MEREPQPITEMEPSPEGETYSKEARNALAVMNFLAMNREQCERLPGFEEAFQKSGELFVALSEQKEE